jgi:hypothetical protein
VSSDDELVSLELSFKFLSGLRNALLEAITDLSYLGSAAREDLARHLLACLDQFRNDAAGSDSPIFWEYEHSRLSIRQVSEHRNQYNLSMSADLIEIACQAIEHVRGSLLEFEIPIRLRMTPQGLGLVSSELGCSHHSEPT